MKTFALKISILIFASLFSANVRAQKDNNHDSLYTVLVTGCLTRKSQVAGEVASKFGFRYKYIRYNIEGDIISPPNIDSMKKENKKTYDLIAKKQGPNWQKIFHNEVDRYVKNLERIEDFLNSDTLFQTLSTKLHLDSYCRFHISKETKKDKIFVIEYLCYDKDKPSIRDKKRFKVNLPKLKVAVETDN